MGSGISSPRGTCSIPLNTIHNDQRYKEITDKYSVNKITRESVYSTSYQITRRNDQQTLSAKMIQSKRITKEQYELIKKEISILLTMNHSNILKIHETITIGNELWVIVDHSEQDLLNKLRYRICSERKVRNIIKIVLESIEYLHNNGIVHRNIRPESLVNVMNNTNDEPILKLGGFGISSYISNISYPLKHEYGSCHYLSPEIIREKEYQTEPDIWSLGVLTYYLLSGDYPFHSYDDNSTMRLIRSGKYDHDTKLWLNISKEAKDFIRHALTVNLKRRWTASKLMKHPWITMEDEKISNMIYDIKYNLNDSNEFIHESMTSLKSIDMRIFSSNKISTLSTVKLSSNPSPIITSFFTYSSSIKNQESIHQSECQSSEYTCMSSGYTASTSTMSCSSNDNSTNVNPIPSIPNRMMIGNHREFVVNDYLNNESLNKESFNAKLSPHGMLSPFSSPKCKSARAPCFAIKETSEEETAYD